MIGLETATNIPKVLLAITFTFIKMDLLIWSQNEYDIEVKDDGSLWYDYMIYLYAHGSIYEDVFFDGETHDTYSLNITDPGCHLHTVNYNSDHQTLITVTVKIKVDTTSQLQDQLPALDMRAAV